MWLFKELRVFMFFVIFKGPFKKYVNILGGRRVKQNSDKVWQGGVKPKSDVTTFQ